MWRILPLLLLTACASHRLLRVENELLRQQNAELQKQIFSLESRMPAPTTYERHPTLETVHLFLDHAGYSHTYTPGATTLRFPYTGKLASFTVTIQHFDKAGVLFMSTHDYMHLDEASNTESLVLLLVQIATINYELLMGKFQLNPETGEVMLSVELPTQEGLGRDTFVAGLEQLLHTADNRYPELTRAAAGLGL